ncbi:anti-sigma factor family protein [Streptomyces sp. NPDC054784]
MNGADNGLTPAEEHLGDRLAALVDGELGHDARERVLSHLATCWSCKAEADAQRRLKNVFADAAPPPPSDGLLARLQGLPAGGDPGSGPGSGGTLGDDDAERGSLPGVLRRTRPPLPLDYFPGGRGASVLTPDRGFRIHRAHEPERAPSRGRRFAFVAAGAFSVAALALSGPLNSGSAGGSPVAAGERGGASAGPTRTPTSPAAAERESRRRGGGDSGQQRAATASPRPAASQSVRTQLVAGMSEPMRDHPLMRGSSAFTPSLPGPPSLSRALAAEKRTPLDAVPGRTPAPKAPAPSPATSAVTPER